MAYKLYLVGMDVQDYNGNTGFEIKYCGYQVSKAKAAYRTWLGRDNVVFKVIENLDEVCDYYQENSQEGSMALLESKIRTQIKEVLGAHYCYKHAPIIRQQLSELSEISFTPQIRKFGNDPNKLKLRMTYYADVYSSGKSQLPLDEIMDCLSFHIKRVKKESGITNIPVLIRLVDSTAKLTQDMEV